MDSAFLSPNEGTRQAVRKMHTPAKQTQGRDLPCVKKQAYCGRVRGLACLVHDGGYILCVSQILLANSSGSIRSGLLEKTKAPCLPHSIRLKTGLVAPCQTTLQPQQGKSIMTESQTKTERRESARESLRRQRRALLAGLALAGAAYMAPGFVTVNTAHAGSRDSRPSGRSRPSY